MAVLSPEAVESLIAKVATLDLTNDEEVVLDILLDRAANSPQPTPDAPETKFFIAPPEWLGALGIEEPESKFMH